MTLIPAGGRLFGVTFVQLFPPSFVSWIRFVLVPTHMTSADTGERASVVIDPPAAGAPTPPPPTAAAAAAPPLTAARSGLTALQVSPRSLERRTRSDAIYKVRGSCGEKASGGAPPNRS